MARRKPTANKPITDSHGYSGADWIRSNGKTTSELGEKAAELLGWWSRGIYHLGRGILRSDWSNEVLISVTVYCGGWSTYDFSDLTRLVVGAHDMCLRVEIVPVAPNRMNIKISPRSREGDPFISHPTIEEAIDRIRAD